MPFGFPDEGRSVLCLVPGLVRLFLRPFIVVRRPAKDGIERMPQDPRLARHVRDDRGFLQGLAETVFDPVGAGRLSD